MMEMFQQAMKQNMPQQPQEEIPPEDDNGIPLPPGMTTQVTDYQSKQGKIKVYEIRERNTNYILYGTLANNVQGLIFAFFFNFILMAIRQFFDYLRNAFNLIKDAITHPRLTIEQRLILVAESILFLGLAIFKAYKCGFIGTGPVKEVHNPATPFIIRIA
ncbi:hypothetical protein TVAG_277000 [Trichomonas vaginalis G3]|uniref:Uncharacterized protein n=1 Tax=Trichomonas vaginalis (strain ATCC PRA-98 / G3) TaxID=412133 RepID=A2FP60_TRIV3|nr:hypothetical protein TVAGG3_0154760 [Trichomonas vaginalis G3]EAX93295.1 hypothetical protein TVAG_277000 [Trichomonas vaginalis G3]KAI5547494.1 hypothetical protein TVAGG3_0154760 [Trichomonas vaginalis G3]|eukprot:XP_001306225.1 hypothetical protein [Trichomonas vaginalis G3]